MDPLDQSIDSSQNAIINEQSRKFILEIAKWARFLAILGYIGLGLAVLGIIIMMGTTLGMSGSRYGALESLVFLLYLAIIALYFFPINYLYKAAVRLKSGLNSNEGDTLTSGFENLKSHYKFLGIFTIVLLSLYLLVAVGAVLVYAVR